MAFVCILAACESAKLRINDAGPAPDARAIEGDATPAPDSGTVDAADEMDALEPPVRDGSIDTGPPTEPEAPMAPVPPAIPWAPIEGGDLSMARPEIVEPAPPVLTVDGACPTGWTLTTMLGDPPTCEPWPSGSHETCSSGEAHFPGRPGCEPIGAACPLDDWPAGIPAGAIYVDDTATTTTGDGSSRANAYRSIGAAITGAPSIGSIVIAIAAGTYDDALVITRANTTLLGTCPERTLLTRSAGVMVTDYVVVVRAVDVVMQDLTVGGGGAGVRASTGGSLTMTGVEVRDVVGDGVHAEPGTITARKLRVLRAGGDGIEARAGGSITASSLEVIDSSDSSMFDRAGVAANLDGATVTIEDAVVDRIGSIGLAARDDATIIAGRSVVERAMGSGTHAARDSLLDLSDIVVRGIRQSAGGGDGEGISLVVRGSAHLTRILVEDCSDTGLQSDDPLTELVVTDAVVRDIRQHDRGYDGQGARPANESRATMTRVAFRRTAASGVFAWDNGTAITLNDVSIEDASEEGVLLDLRLTADLHRVSITRAVGAGLYLYRGPIVTANDVSIRDIAPATGAGHGVFVEGGSLDLANAVIEGAAADGIVVTDSSFEGRDFAGSATLTDVAVSWTPTARGGVGARADDGALTATRLLVSRAHGWGVIAERGSVVRLDDAIISSTEPTSEATLGVGLGALDGGLLTLRGALVRTTRDIGLWVDGPGSSLDAMNLLIEDTGSFGLLVAEGTAGVGRVAITRAHEAGVLVRGGSPPVEITDLVVSGTLEATPGTGGYGLICDGAAELDVTRAELAGNVRLGVGAFGVDTELVMASTRVTDTSEGASGAPSASAGAYDGARLRLSAFVMDDGGACGLEIGGRGVLEAESGTVTTHDVGVCAPDTWSAGASLALSGNGVERDAATSTTPRAVRATPSR